MKAKTIKSVCRHKLDAWLKTITDEAVRKLAAENTIITGGAIASMLLGEKVNDFDLYFRDWKTTVAVAGYYVKKFKENPPAKFQGDPGREVSIWLSDGAGNRLSFYRENEYMISGPGEDRRYVDFNAQGQPTNTDGRVKIVVKSAGVASETTPDTYQYFECNPDPESTSASEYVEACAAALVPPADEQEEKKKDKFRPIFLTSNAITLSDGIQLVTRFYGEPDAIHENYDFVHCTCYWSSWDGRLELRPKALEALLARELRYVGSKYPLCSIIRTRKFIQRGWTINAGQFVKMAMHLNDLDLCDMKVLEDQMTGVDAAYFQEIIEALKKKDDARVDRAYLLQLIDRIF